MDKEMHIEESYQEPNKRVKNKNVQGAAEPTIAPSMEMDELEVDATSEEIKKGDYTPVTKLFIDRVD